MIERYLYTALRAGLDAITADPALIEDIFDWLYELDAEEVEAIKAWFAAKPPSLYHGYAPVAFELPFFSIVLAAEGKSEGYLGDDAGIIDDEDDPDYQNDARTLLWNHEYRIFCYSDHPDITRYMYEIAKAILLNQRDYFVGKLLWDLDLAGADLSPDEAHVPPNLFVRMLTFKCSSEFMQVARDSRIGKAFSIGKVHVLDTSESIAEVGGVSRGVTPYTEDGD